MQDEEAFSAWLALGDIQHHFVQHILRAAFFAGRQSVKSDEKEPEKIDSPCIYCADGKISLAPGSVNAICPEHMLKILQGVLP